MGEVVYLPVPEQATTGDKEAYDLSRAMDEALGLIARGLDDIETGRNVDGALQSVTANLLHILRLVERTPAIEEALDDLHEVARRLTHEIRTGGSADPDLLRRLQGSYLTFRSHIAAAQT